jgi:hypothetical protein
MVIHISLNYAYMSGLFRFLDWNVDDWLSSQLLQRSIPYAFWQGKSID